MKAPRLRAWHPELKIMEYPETIFTKENIHMLLNEDDYIWMKSADYLDKNRKEIFEGDVLKSPSQRKSLSVVTWDNEIEVCGCGGADAISAVGLSLGEIWGRDEIEVIGNIYENPELMEGK